MRSFFATLLRQRRRLFVGLLLGWFFILSHSEYLFTGAPMWAVVLTLLIMAPVFLLPMVAFIMLLPSMRTIVEVLAVNAALNFALRAALPGVFELFDAYGMGIVLWLAIFLTVNFSMYGTLLDGLPGWFSYTGRAGFRTKAAASDIFAAFIPAEGHEGSYRCGTLQYLGPDPDDPESYNVRYAVGEGLFEMQKITPLEDFEAPYRARYYFIGDVTAQNAAFAEGVFDLTITELENDTRSVRVIEEHPALRLRTALFLWFDDHTGDVVNSVRAQVEGKRDFSYTGRFWRKQAKLV
ncbi:hypothetical protein [Litoreibacter arenae]|uniref:Uncharacterized protein n=1 Tax=Litoreibacter arenae DSM 19593 TaxID=1123360 RepID=S9S156_9RHOB|nr:hypothetical protein [Litoreibacter arenae]EPX79964.1 hypothetical protein thalar_01300 [Litoreibacter arenae DSM 19593]